MQASTKLSDNESPPAVTQPVDLAKDVFELAFADVVGCAPTVY
jgi:hypothetical protein